MKNIQYYVLAVLFVVITSGRAMSTESRSVHRDLVNANTVCSTVPSRTETITMAIGNLSRKGRADKMSSHGKHVQYASRYKDPARSGHTLHVQASAYALYGRTSTGTVTEHGSIAVDPRVIPYGSKIFVPGYGWGTAVDSGGAIQGRIIDLWMPSNGQCYQWGRRDIDIVIQPPERKK